MAAPVLQPPPADAWRDPIRAQQHTFRATLAALAMPGEVQQLIAHPALHRLDLDPQTTWSATLLLMMLDHEVSLAVAPAPYADALRDLVQRRLRVELTSLENADVVVADGARLTPDDVIGLRRGSLHYPNDSATLVIVIESLAPSTGLNGRAPHTLTGPGIDGSRVLALPALSAEILAAREFVVAQYPMGIDILLLDTSGRMLGIPRTTRITLPLESEV